MGHGVVAMATANDSVPCVMVVGRLEGNFLLEESAAMNFPIHTLGEPE